jgi:hypothetical protein
MTADVNTHEDTHKSCTESDWMQSQSYLIGHVTPQGVTIDAERLRELYWQARYAVSMLTQD